MRTAAAALGIVALGCLLSACTHGNDGPAPLLPAPSSSAQARAPLSPTPISTPIVPSRRASSSQSGSPSASAFSEAYVVFCNGRPTGEQVIAAVRRTRSNLPAGNGVSVQKQPLCAGVWQYTILSVTDSEPLRVVTKGDPKALTVVTAGTDPCTVQVRATAPPALLAAADC